MKYAFRACCLAALAGLLAVGTGCDRPGPVVIPAFYYWKTQAGPDAAEIQWCDSLKTGRLYVRLFDVVWQGGQAIPVAIHLADTHPQSTHMERVPVVFITHESLAQTQSDQIPPLATNMARKMRLLTLGWNVKEWQLDCDWTGTTREKYFQLIQLLQHELGGKWSATIRLHQVKYREETGVPPVDRGVLMFYNMGELSDVATQNSILDMHTARPYLARLPEYPLTLDLALPVFSWGVVFRGNRPVHLLEGLATDTFSDTSLFTNLGHPWYQIRKSTYIGSYYGYQDDRIRVESVSAGALRDAAQVLQPFLPTAPDDTLHLLFYHLDASSLQSYRVKDLSQVVQFFRKPS